jgi:hypothetical protein
MKPFEVLYVSVEEWVLVIPFNFESDYTTCEVADVVDFMRLTFFRLAADNSLNNEVVFAPALLLDRNPPLASFAVRVFIRISLLTSGQL